MSIRLFIADVDPVFTSRVASSVARARGIEVAGCAADGLQALHRLSSLQPCVLLTDVQLPGMDGITLIRRVQALKTPPVCIVCARFYSDMILDVARRSGAYHFLYKPIQYESLPRIIENCWNACQAKAGSRAIPLNQPDMPKLRELLHSLGMPAHMSGTLYAMEACLRLMENETLLNNLSKGLFAGLAEQMQSTPSRIERSMRSAIGFAYQNGALGKRFESRPSNRRFLRYVYGQMRKGDDAMDNLWL